MLSKDIEPQRIIDLYESGVTIRGVIEQLGIEDMSPMTMQRMLKNAGVTLRPRGTQRVDAVCQACGNTFVARSYNSRFCLTCCPDKTWVQRYELYGLTYPMFYAMLEKQSGLCDLCELPLPVGNISQIKIDHCHKQGHTRALLHHRCNAGLGYIEDDKFLANAVRYIERHRK